MVRERITYEIIGFRLPGLSEQGLKPENNANHYDDCEKLEDRC
jgi:hypothetical protein